MYQNNSVQDTDLIMLEMTLKSLLALNINLSELSVSFIFGFPISQFKHSEVWPWNAKEKQLEQTFKTFHITPMAQGVYSAIGENSSEFCNWPS